MEIRILRATGALTDATDRILFPMAGDVIEVSDEQAESMVSAKHAEYVNPDPPQADETGVEEAPVEKKPKEVRARKPKRTTVAEGPQETR